MEGLCVETLKAGMVAVLKVYLRLCESAFRACHSRMVCLIEDVAMGASCNAETSSRSYLKVAAARSACHLFADPILRITTRFDAVRYYFTPNCHWLFLALGHWIGTELAYCSLSDIGV